MKVFLEEISPISQLTVVYRRDNIFSFYDLIGEIIRDPGAYYDCRVTGPATTMRDAPEQMTTEELAKCSYQILFLDLESAKKVRKWVEANQ